MFKISIVECPYVNLSIMAQSRSVDRDCAYLELCIFDVDYVGLSAFTGVVRLNLNLG
jgi:hypothetical protein